MNGPRRARRRGRCPARAVAPESLRFAPVADLILQACRDPRARPARITVVFMALRDYNPFTDRRNETSRVLSEYHAQSPAHHGLRGTLEVLRGAES